MGCQDYPVRSKRDFRNPNDFKPNGLCFGNSHSLKVFGLYSYPISKSMVSIVSIMDNSIIRFIINSFIPNLCHANQVVANFYMVSSMIIPIRCMMMATMRMLLIEMVKKMIFACEYFMRSRNILLK